MFRPVSLGHQYKVLLSITTYLYYIFSGKLRGESLQSVGPSVRLYELLRCYLLHLQLGSVDVTERGLTTQSYH